MTESSIKNSLEIHNQPIWTALLFQTIGILMVLALAHMFFMLFILGQPIMPVVLDGGLSLALLIALGMMHYQWLRLSRA